MDIVLIALKGAIKLWLMLIVIVVPLTIIYEFLKVRQAQLEKRRHSVLGIGSGGFVPLVTGIIIGITYGAGVIIHSIRESNISKREAFLILLFLSICHAIIEDTLIFVVIGADGLILVVIRFFLAILFTWVVYRAGLLKKAHTQNQKS